MTDRDRFCQAKGQVEAVCALPPGHESDHYCCGRHPPWPITAEDIPTQWGVGE